MLRQTMEMMRNPNAMQQAMRSQDLAMSQIENLPGGFSALRRMYEEVKTFFFSLLKFHLFWRICCCFCWESYCFLHLRSLILFNILNCLFDASPPMYWLLFNSHIIIHWLCFFSFVSLTLSFTLFSWSVYSGIWCVIQITFKIWTHAESNSQHIIVLRTFEYLAKMICEDIKLLLCLCLRQIMTVFSLLNLNVILHYFVTITLSLL